MKSKIEKTEKPEGNLQSYNFPEQGVTIEATSLKEATQKLHSLSAKEPTL